MFLTPANIPAPSPIDPNNFVLLVIVSNNPAIFVKPLTITDKSSDLKMFSPIEVVVADNSFILPSNDAAYFSWFSKVTCE